jgi:hypothetical protein
MLAGLLALGVDRDNAYQALPKWRTHSTRPSCLDLIALLRKEMAANPALLTPFGFRYDWKSLALAAAA